MRYGYEVRGAALPGESTENLLHLRPRIKVDRFDITDREACRRVLNRAQPEILFHLAAFASVGGSFAAAEPAFRVNTIGSYHVLEAVREKSWLKRLLLVSSADVYGPVRPKDLPLKPDRLFDPRSPYAQSKAAAEYLARMYTDQYQAPVIIARSFNHTGPRQSPEFVIPAFCRKIVAAERSRGKKGVTVGNLSARRDLSDVRDIVRGYRLLSAKGQVGQAYHLCSGKAYSIRELLNKLIAFSDIPIHVRPDKRLVRKVDIPVLQGSFAATRQAVGWKPLFDIETTLKDTLNYWRNRTDVR